MQPDYVAIYCKKMAKEQKLTKLQALAYKKSTEALIRKNSSYKSHVINEAKAYLDILKVKVS